MKHLIKGSIIIIALMFMASGAYAAAGDGGHWFSVDPDTALGGINGDVYYTSENGTNSLSYNIPVGDQQIDALSSGAHPIVTLSGVHGIYDGTFFMNYSVEGFSDIWEVTVNSTVIPNAFTPNPPSYLGPRGIISEPWIHDNSSTLGLTNKDLDALESDTHVSPYPHPFPTHGSPTYFSVEGSGSRDTGDVYDTLGLYVDDSNIAATAYFANLGFDPATDQIDDLVVFDVLNSATTFDAASSLYGSDVILFTLAPGTFDNIGDNVYWYSAYNGGTGGLYVDPGSSTNWDALDVHATPEPISSTLFLVGAATLGFRRFRKANKV